MKKATGLFTLALAAALGASAQTTVKVGVINMQAAIVGTKDGQKAAAELETKMGPRRKDVDAKQAEINALREQLQKGQNTLSDSAKAEIYRNIDQKTKVLNRTMEDDQAELEQEQQQLLQELGQKIQVVIDKYARDNAFSLIVDDSGQQSPIVWASSAVDITKDVIDLYDKNAGAMAPATSSLPAPRSGGTAARPAPGTTSK